MYLPLVTVIVPIYNLEKYLDICLESIVRQSYPNLEIILVNDGSTDGSLTLCEMYAKLDTRIHVISQKNSGVSVARNTGLKHAKGEYICFIDGDDYIISNYIQLLVDAILEHKADMSVCHITKLKHSRFHTVPDSPLLPSVSILNSGQALCQMIYQKAFSWEVVAKLYSRKSIHDLQFDKNERIGEDFTFSYHYLHHCQRIAVCQFTGYFYLLREGSATQSHFSEKHRDILNVANKFEQFIQDKYPALSHCSTYFTLYAYVDLVDRLYFTEHADKEEIRLYRQQIIKRIGALLNNEVKYKFKLRVLIMLFNQSLYKFIKRRVN